MAKKNVIRSDASVTVVRVFCYMAVIVGIAMLGYGIFTAINSQLSFEEILASTWIIPGIGLIVGACVVLMFTNIADDLKTLRVNEYGIQGKTREFRNELLDRMHVAEQENMHLIRQQDEIIQLLKEAGGKAERSGRRSVRVETAKEEETDYELDLH
ncbi:MAG: hypothetical protein IJL36_05395 [Clostridia bacterium]|nr:hypothetical protein [Clostridia bacterium]